MRLNNISGSLKKLYVMYVVKNIHLQWYKNFFRNIVLIVTPNILCCPILNSHNFWHPFLCVLVLLLTLLPPPPRFYPCSYATVNIAILTYYLIYTTDQGPENISGYIFKKTLIDRIYDIA